MYAILRFLPVFFDVYGFHFQLTSRGDGESAVMLANDFAYFRRESVESPFVLRFHAQDPPYDGLPDRIASVYTPRNISLTVGERTYVDYSGRAIAIVNHQERSFDVYSCNAELSYEAAYLFLLSRIGEFLDARRLHRLHAMALGYQGSAVLAILPMGGGKSTLGAELLKCCDYGFLSDDSPFIGRDGTVYAFPLRLGLLPGGESEIPPEHRRVLNRMEFGPKILVNYDYFAHRVIPSAAPGIVFLGYRSLAQECRIEPAGWRESMHSIVANCVIGLGLFQGLEFMVRARATELAGKAGAGWSRLRNARALFRRSQVYRLILGRDRERNARTVTEFVRSRLDGRGSKAAS
ncbi:MAG: hypothetical protein ACRD44_06115 [Bryobacteraceae bacterium]